MPHGIIQTFFDFGFAAEACVPWPAGWSGNVGCLGGGISGMFAGFCDASDPAKPRTKWMLNSTALKVLIPAFNIQTLHSHVVS